MQRAAKPILLFLSLSLPLLPSIAQDQAVTPAPILGLDSVHGVSFNLPVHVQPTWPSVDLNLLPDAAPQLLSTVALSDSPRNDSFLLPPNSCFSSSEIGLVSTCLTADNINLDVPAIGVITGAGSVSSEGALNFKMLANLSGGAVGGVTKVATAGSGKGGVPFAISGTTSDPKFVPDVGGVAGGVATGAVKDVAKAPGAAVSAPTKAVGGLAKKSN